MSKKTFKKIKGKFFPLENELMNSAIVKQGMITALDIIAYQMIGLQKTGDRKHDSELKCPYWKVAHLMSEPRYTQAKFRLWAYRMILVSEWGRKKRRASRFMMFNKWRTLIRMPERLEKIHKLVNEYEKLHRKKLNNPHSSRPAMIKAKRMKRIGIKKKITGIRV
ncbi:hypothetical protein ES705_22839 [subsurface metagenome]